MRQPAKEPEDLARFFVERINDGDLEGVVALYEVDAVLACGDSRSAIGREQIRSFYKLLLADRPQFKPGVHAPALRNGCIVLTSTILGNGDITAEIARQQSDGNWLWAVDQPAIGKG